MLTVTDRFLAALRESHTVSVAAYLYPASGGDPILVPVIGGSVTVDRDAAVRRQATLDIAFALGDTVTDDLIRELPFGGYATVERGILFADGTDERVQLGMFRIDSVVWTELQGQASLTLNDRMAQIQDEAFVTPYDPVGLTATAAVVALVEQVFGSNIAYHVLTSPGSESALVDTVYDEDRGQAISDLASSVNAEAFFDNNGDFVIRPRATVGPVAWTVDAGTGGVLVASTETLDRSTVRNGVAVRGQSSADVPPFYSLATYDDPSAPTRWGGPFGKVVLVSESTAVTTQAQADATAASLLNLRLGMSCTVALNTVPNPAIEPGDLIEIVYADGRTEQQLVNAVQLDLGADAELQITTTGQYLGASTLELPTVRLYQGPELWQQLDGARLVPA